MSDPLYETKLNIAEAVSLAHHPTLHNWNDNTCVRCWSAAEAVVVALELERAKKIEDAAAKVATPEHFEMADMPKSLWNAIVELSNVLHGKNPDGSLAAALTPDNRRKPDERNGLEVPRSSG